MNKKIILLAFVLVCLLSNFAFAQTIDSLNLNQIMGSIVTVEKNDTVPTVASDAPIRVQLNGNFLDFKDNNGNVSNPKIINNRTMVPMRKIFEAFNASVEWDDTSKTVVAKTDSKEITLTIGNEKATIKDLNTNNTETSTLDQAPVISENRTLVPVRFIAEGLEKDVAWDANQRAVIVIDDSALVEKLEEKVPTLKKLFELKLGENSAYSSTSKIQGKLSYTDAEDAKNSETIAIVGTSDIKVNEKDDMDATVNFSISGGNGQIMEQIKNQKYDNLEGKVILVDGKIYLGIKEDGQYKWTESSEDINKVNLPSMPNTLSNISSYEATLEYIKSFIGDKNVNTYKNLLAIIDMLPIFINDETIQLSKDTIKIDIDLIEIIKKMGAKTEEIPVSKLELIMDIKVKDGKVSSEKLEFAIKMDSIESLENLDLNIEIQTEYKELDKNFEIKAPIL